MSTKRPKNVEKMSENLSGGTENTIFRHFLDIFCLFGRCFCLVTLSNARPLRLLTCCGGGGGSGPQARPQAERATTRDLCGMLGPTNSQSIDVKEFWFSRVEFEVLMCGGICVKFLVADFPGN